MSSLKKLGSPLQDLKLAFSGLMRTLAKPWIIILLLISASVFLSVRYFIPRSIVPGGFLSGVADTGMVVRTVDAQGIIVPENEVFLRAYSSAVIKRIVKSPGSHIQAGDVILLMETEQIVKEVETAEDQLEVMRNNLSKNRLNARSSKVDLEYNLELKKLKITSLKSDLTDQEQLLEVGGISPARIEKTKQELVIADMELETAQQKKAIQLKQMEADEEGLLLQIAMKEKDIEEKKETLSKMTVRTPSAGIVLNIYGNEGEKINGGELLAQISNMTSFKVNASIAEDYADMVKTGGEVLVSVNEDFLPGKIGRVLPVIENNKVNFEIFLAQNSHPDLIPNMKVDIKVIVARKDNVLRVHNGQAFDNTEKQNVFVLKGNKAIRKEVITGLKGSDYIEIISGINAGDIIILSDISSFRHMKEVDIEN